MTSSPGLLEVCVDTAAGLQAAWEGGADRIELCSALELGGLTPSPGLLSVAAAGPIPVFVMVRPRAGDFVFSTRDVDVMRREIDAVADAAARVRGATQLGLVLGASTAEGRLSLPVLEHVLRHAAGAGLRHATLHRAFDLVREPLAALEDAVALGFERILTSGCAPKAQDGAHTLRALHEQAAGRITIMAGSGITPANVAAIMAATGIRDIHASCRSTAEQAPSHPRCDELGFGSNPVATDAGVVRTMKARIAACAQASGIEHGEKHA